MMNNAIGKTVTIFGSSRPQQGDRAYQAALDLGQALAEAGFAVCNGGYGGTMEASARGARSAGGATIAVTCKTFGRAGANPYNDRVHEAEDLFDRLRILIDHAHAFIILPGGSGTLVELATVWELTAKHLIRTRPIIVYGRFWKPVIEITARERPKSLNHIRFADSPEQVVKLLECL